MKPRLHNRVLAHFPAVLAQGGGVALVSAVSVACAPMFEAPFDVLSAATFVLAVSASYALGALVSVAFLGRLFYPLVAKLAGAPFSVGDWVIVRRGARCGAIAQVYEVWSKRGQVRPRLSEEERQVVADVYSYHEIVRDKEPNKTPEPTRLPVMPRAMESEWKWNAGPSFVLLHESRPAGVWLIFDVGRMSDVPLLISPKLAEKVADFRESAHGATLVTLVLKDGSRISRVTLAWSREIVQIDGNPVEADAELGFDRMHIVDVLPCS